VERVYQAKKAVPPQGPCTAAGLLPPGGCRRTGLIPEYHIRPLLSLEKRATRVGAIMKPTAGCRPPALCTTVNLPNSITMSRIVMIPLLLWILSPHFPWQGSSGEQELLASILFVLASMTDGLDGYLARKRGQITTIGMLLDPLADKILVTAALIALVAYNPQVVKVWIAVVIIGREFLISGLRSIAASEGFTIQASDLGKLKTVTQIVSVVSAILAHHWFQWQIGVLILPVKWTAVTAIYFTVAVSTISAIDYFVGFWKKIDHASQDRRGSTFVLTRRKGAGTASTN
jgi:CDP-diacylglycerol--glycerol-3-phosphate 3-phosphatidyltransferase